jgi:hypothetical protein
MSIGSGSYYQERILAVLVHIQRNLNEELSLDLLARVACFILGCIQMNRSNPGEPGE